MRKHTDHGLNFEKKIIIKQCDEPEKLIDVIKQFLLHWCHRTANHGFSNLVKTSNMISKLFWISILITFFIYCFSSNYLFSEILFIFFFV